MGSPQQSFLIITYYITVSLKIISKSKNKFIIHSSNIVSLTTYLKSKFYKSLKVAYNFKFTLEKITIFQIFEKIKGFLKRKKRMHQIICKSKNYLMIEIWSAVNYSIGQWNNTYVCQQFIDLQMVLWSADSSIIYI